MGVPRVLTDVAIGTISGYAGLQVMDRVTTMMWDMEPPEDKEREKRISSEPAYNVAAKQLAARVGVRVSEQEAGKLGNAFHVGLGLAGGEMYMLLRRRTSLDPVASALVMSMVLFLGVDEGLTYLMGWSAPPAAYPPETHLRGLIGHLALGATVASTAEFLSWLIDAR